jgi:hypothetical protein
MAPEAALIDPHLTWLTYGAHTNLLMPAGEFKVTQ